MSYKILYKSKKSLARIGELETGHGRITTPVFMPVGTLGAVKTLTPEELEKLGAEIILGNTYHLYLRPGEKLIKKMGGLHQFMKWKKPILTDSGGYQVFSLGENLKKTNNQDTITKQFPITNNQFPNNHQSEIVNLKSNLVKIQTDGVEFRSHLDGSKHFFTPEKVIDIQRNFNSDIMMVLDVCTEYPASYKRAKETMELTHRWAEQAARHWAKIKNQKSNLKMINQNSKINLKSEIINHKFPMLFGIVQGSTYQDLRAESTKYISSLAFDGIAVGGVSVGEGKKHMYEVMKWVGPLLPKDKPHYLMGIGEPEDLIEAIKNGFDMFDCVLPTRLARHGVVWINTKSEIRNSKRIHFSTTLGANKSQFSKLDLRKSVFRSDQKPLDLSCQCYTCRKGFSRAYLNHLIREKEMLGYRLATIHNLHFIINLIKEVKRMIIKGQL